MTVGLTAAGIVGASVSLWLLGAVFNGLAFWLGSPIDPGSCAVDVSLTLLGLSAAGIGGYVIARWGRGVDVDPPATVIAVVAAILVGVVVIPVVAIP